MTHRPPEEPVRPHPRPRPARLHPREFAEGGPGVWSGTLPRPGRADPAVLGALLGRHGWRRRGGAAGRYARWTPPEPGGAGTSLLVPENRAFPDSEDLLEEALTALARCAAPSAREILIALAVPSDEVRWWREVREGPSGAASWAAQERLRSAARAMLLAGALAAVETAGYFGARHRRTAETALEEALVGSARGGRALTAFLPVAGGRRVVSRLHHALHATREAIDYQRATGGMEAFDAAVRAGVCHELTEAVVALVRGTEGARVALEWAPAAAAPEDCPAGPEPVEFSPGDLPALRAAGARYVKGEPAVPVRLTGAVVRLRRSAPGGSGTVRLRVLEGADVTHVRAVLDEEGYRTAGQAHLAGLPVLVSGRLESRGGFRRLTGAREVVALRVDGAERDRLMKSFQERADSSEET
ncbi:hypothetical protein [Streptomyces sp. GC420]|uniref:hypothetical protein n=1 Tax=Streptomyces sp. GC420 TaxID=2697568 RepID=UPI001415235D|nr:hypothetical protein [Streptomyces sp. GC420]NBM16413.1 hypothetical protein [Streptomyces sp. GC420]